MMDAKAVTARIERHDPPSYEEAKEVGSIATQSARQRPLVERLKAGDAEAFDVAFQRHVSQVFRKALRLLGNEADAEDVVQEVFLTVHKKAKTFRGECALSTWLYRLTVNAALGKLRRQKRSKEILYDDYLPKFQKDGHHAVRPVADWSEKIDDDRSDRRELQRLLKQALEQLKPVDKAVVVLSDLEGYLDREIASTLGLSVSAVKTRLHRSRLFLRGRLAAHLGYSPA